MDSRNRTKEESIMAKSEAEKTTSSGVATPKSPKPRLRQAKDITLFDPVRLQTGPTTYVIRGKDTSITVDLDGHCVTIKAKGAPSKCLPFHRVKEWTPDVGTATE